MRTDPDDYLLFEWKAFGELSSARHVAVDRSLIPWSTAANSQVVVDRGPIPWPAIDRFAERFGIDHDEFERFAALIRAMDDAYLAYFKR